MYPFKFLARSFGLTIPVMLRMLPIVGITFFLVGVLIYALWPYPLAVKILLFVFSWPLMILLALSAVRSALAQMKETTAPDPGKVLRKTMQLTAFHFAIAALFGLLSWFVTSSLVPEDWLENSSIHFNNSNLLEESSSARGPINLPTISQPGRRNSSGPFQPAVDLSELNPDGVERRENAPTREETRRDNRPEPVAPEPEPEPEPEIEEEITTVTIEGVAAVEPSFAGFIDHIKSSYGRLIIGYFSVQGLYWLVLSALAVPFAAQAATAAARGPAHEFLWGTGKKAGYVFILMVLTNALSFFGFLALTFYLGTSLTLAFQDLDTTTLNVANLMQTAWIYLGALALLSYFTYCLMASGAAVAYVDSRAEMQQKKDAELGRILASAEEGPDLRALIKERSKGRTIIPQSDSDGTPSSADGSSDVPGEGRPTIRPAAADEDVGGDFIPMVSTPEGDELPDTPSGDPLVLLGADKGLLSLQEEDITRHPPLQLGGDTSDAEAPALEEDPEEDPDYDEDWFLKPLPSEMAAEEAKQETELPANDVADESENEKGDEEDIEWIRNLFKEEEEKK